MKITLDCMTCLAHPESLQLPWPRAMKDLEESGIYEFECEFGHRTVFCLDNPRFQLLFDLGLRAILDGYYREAVSAFASALERFHETYVRIVAEAAGTPAEAFNASWKQMKKQSERQLGAFVVLYTVQEKEVPPLLDSHKEIPFRNDVIHAGKFPTRDEAIDFGQAVNLILDKVIRRLRGSHDQAVKRFAEKYRDEIRARAGGRSFHSLSLLGFVQFLGELRESPQDVRSWVENVQKYQGDGSR
jgi:hypothetical protein